MFTPGSQTVCDDPSSGPERWYAVGGGPGNLSPTGYP
jgi:hypothetical protein